LCLIHLLFSDPLPISCQYRRYIRPTISTYLYWIKSFIIYHHKRHPEERHDVEVELYLTDLAVNRSVAIATQKVALNALAFLYNKFLEKPLGDVSQFRRVRKQAKIPTVLTRQAVSAITSRLHGVPKLVASLLYGSTVEFFEFTLPIQ
jgi:hypothetical protein